MILTHQEAVSIAVNRHFAAMGHGPWLAVDISYSGLGDEESRLYLFLTDIQVRKLITLLSHALDLEPNGSIQDSVHQ